MKAGQHPIGNLDEKGTQMETKAVKPIQKGKKLGNVKVLQGVKALKSKTALKAISSLRRGPSIV